MLALVAAGGSGTRMKPVTKWINKHLIPLCNGELMIDKPLQFLKKHGFEEICIVTGCSHAGQISEHIGDGEEHGFKRVEYFIQKKPLGISDVLNRISHKDASDGVLLILGDNYFSSVQQSVGLLDRGDAAAWEYDLGDPGLASRFGQYIAGQIVEKPPAPVHSRVLTGLYYFPCDVFDRLNDLSPSARGELEITDLLGLYLDEGRLSVHAVEGEWCDLGEWDSLTDFIVAKR